MNNRVVTEHAEEPLDHRIEARAESNVFVWRWPIFAAAVLFSAVLGSLDSFTAPAYVVFFAGGLTVCAVAWFRPPRRIPPPPGISRRGFAVWFVICAAFTVQELVNFFIDAGLKPEHPSLSILVAPMLEIPLLKAIAVFIWLGIGIEMVRR